MYREIQALIRHGSVNLSLLQALLFEEKTERQYADELGVYRNAVHARKIKVLKKLRALLKGSIEKP